MGIDSEIEELAARRSDIWAGRDVGDVDVIERKLDALYEARRTARARDRSGRSHAEIVKQARVESELERLMSDGKSGTRTDV